MSWKACRQSCRSCLQWGVDSEGRCHSRLFNTLYTCHLLISFGCRSCSSKTSLLILSMVQLVLFSVMHANPRPIWSTLVPLLPTFLIKDAISQLFNGRSLLSVFSSQRLCCLKSSRLNLVIPHSQHVAETTTHCSLIYNNNSQISGADTWQSMYQFWQMPSPRSSIWCA